MKVAHLIKATRIGGAERHLLILLPQLYQHGIEPHLLLLVEPDNLMDDLVQEARQRDIPVQRIIIHHHADVFVVRRIVRRLRQLQPAILHTHLIHADTYGTLAGKLARIPCIISSRHNDDAFRRRQPVQWLNELQWRSIDAGIAISKSIRDFTIQVENAPAHKLHTVHYGIEKEPFQPGDKITARRRLLDELHLPADTVLLGMACRLVEQKGVSYAIQAMALLSAAYPQAHLLIAGDGDLLESLQRESRQQGMSARVHFLGWRSDIPQFMAALDIFVMPSLWEGFGLVALEAMAQRVPVVASRVSAIPEVVTHGEAGLLVAPRHAQALADALRLLLEDRNLRAHMGLLAEDRVEHYFSAEKMAMNTRDVYRRVAAKQH